MTAKTATNSAPKGPSCADCIHLHVPPRHDDQTATRGLCRRYPPTGTGMQGGQFPLVPLEAVCGEHPDMQALARA